MNTATQAFDGTILLGKVIDGTLNNPIEHGAVAFEGERISWVGEAAQLPERFKAGKYQTVDLSGRSILPGLIDGHTHISFGEARSEEELALYTPVEMRALKAIWNARKVLQAGVTSAFDAATTYDIAQSIRDAIDSGMFEGPRFAVSGKQLTSHQGLEDSFPNNMEFPPGQAALLMKTKDDLVEAIRYQVKDRVDCIKISGSNDQLITPDSLEGAAFDQDEFNLIAREAHRTGAMCSVHARSRASILCAARAGFDLIFHGSYIDDEAIELCLKNNVTITPTLTMLINIIESTPAMAGRSSVAGIQREVDAAQENLTRAYKAGVPMVCGSEAGWSPVPYGDWHAREMEVFVTLFGMSPLEAIHTSTLQATRVLKRFGHNVGKLEAGRLADILIVNGDPTKDIKLLQYKSKIEMLFKGGRSVDLTPQAPRREWFYEKHRMLLDGRFYFNEATGRGELRP